MTSSDPAQAARSIGRAERLAPLLAGLAIALPQVAFRYPPMADLSFHQGLVAILRHFHDPSLYPQGLYVHNFGHANQLFYLLSWGLSYVFSVELSCKLVVAATLFAIPVAAAHFADYLGASRWTALLLAPVALGWLYYWGLIANLMGLAALLALLPTLDKLAEAPSWRRAFAACAGCLLMYEAHELMLIVYGGAAIIFAAGHELHPRKTLQRLSPFVTAAALSCFEQVLATLHQTEVNRRTTVIWSPLWRKLYTIPGVLFGGLEPPFVYTTAAVSAVALTLFLVARAKAPTPTTRPGTRAFLHRFRFELFGLSCLALYLALPANVHAATLVYHRFIAPAYAVLVVCASPRGAHSRVRLAPMVTSVVTIAPILTLLPLIIDASDTAADVDRLMPQMQKDCAVAVIDVGPLPKQQRTNALLSDGDRVLTFLGGRLGFSFAVSAVAPVQYAQGYGWDEYIQRTMFHTMNFRPAHDFTRFRYLLMRSTSALLTTGIAVVIAPQARLVDTAGDWTLFESKLPTVSLLSPDVPLPKPHPDTLRLLLKKFVESRDAPLAPSEIQPEADPNAIDDGLALPSKP